MKNLKKIVITTAAIAAAMALTGCGQKAKVDWNEFAQPEYTGYSGMATVGRVIDRAELEKYVLSTVMDEDAKGEERMETMQNLTAFESSIKVDVSPKENLSNGDELTVTVTCDVDKAKEAGISVKEESQLKITVTDLEEPTMFDPFDPQFFGNPDGVEVEFYGASPNLTMNLDENYLHFGPDRYQLDAEEGTLSNGDVVHITFVPDESLAQNGQFPTRTELDYTVENQPERLNTNHKLSQDDLNYLTQDAISSAVNNSYFIINENAYTEDPAAFARYTGRNRYVTTEGGELTGEMLAVHTNDVILIPFTFSARGEFHFNDGLDNEATVEKEFDTLYGLVVAQDIAIKADGTVDRTQGKIYASKYSFASYEEIQRYIENKRENAQ